MEVFVYGSGGRQSNAVAASPPAVDLTSEGTADWAHWGSLTNTSFDYKAVVPRQISNFTVLGTNAVECYTDNFTAFSWSDGTPLLATNGTPTGVFITGMSNGFSLTTPADWLPRTLRLYVGGYGVQGKFQAYLSDLSASPYTDTSVSNVYGNSFVVYTIHYRAASLNQQLNVVYRALNEFDLTYGNVTLQAATLQSGPSEPLPVQLLDPILSGSYFLFSFVTQSNFNYAIQTLDSLSTTNWRTVTTVPGRGATIIVLSQVGGVLKRFYRVQTQ